MKSESRRCSGFMSFDAIAGLILITAVGSILAMAIVRHSRSENRLADSRAQDRTLEAAILRLQSGDTAKINGVTLRKLDAVAPAGRVWVEVSSGSTPRPAALIGVVSRAIVDRYIAVDGKAKP